MLDRIFILSYVFIFSITQFQHIALAEPYMKLDSVGTCPTAGTSVGWEYKFFEIRENNWAMDSRIALEEDLTEDYQYNLLIHKWSNGAWQENIHQRDGRVCEDVRAYMGGLWDKMVDDGNPPVPGDCPITAGEYNMTNFELIKDDINLPGSLDGRIKLVIEVFDENDLQVFCGEFEGRIQT